MDLAGVSNSAQRGVIFGSERWLSMGAGNICAIHPRFLQDGAALNV